MEFDGKRIEVEHSVSKRQRYWSAFSILPPPPPASLKSPFMCCITLPRTFLTVELELNTTRPHCKQNGMYMCALNVSVVTKRCVTFYMWRSVVGSLVVFVGVSVSRLNFVGHCCGSELVTTSWSCLSCCVPELVLGINFKKCCCWATKLRRRCRRSIIIIVMIFANYSLWGLKTRPVGYRPCLLTLNQNCI